ncbi:MAG: C-GCAxxG-C-C family protein [Lachnospiraceae bacterium]|nr:C-GCAxxG-C-C family protein [Lachnospiraceae bacterium]
MKLLLCGGGCGEQTVEANKVFNSVIDHEKPLLYIPLAMDEADHPYDDCLEWIKGELADVEFPYIEMVRAYEELSDKDFMAYCGIFIGGGNTFSLLKGLKDSGAFSKLGEYIRNNGIVFGGSAGAIIFGKDILTAMAMDPNDVGLEDTAGFDVLGGKSIFAHYESGWSAEEKTRYTQFIKEYSKTHEAVIAIPEEDTVFIDGDKVQVIGDRPYYIYENGQVTEFSGPVKRTKAVKYFADHLHCSQSVLAAYAEECGISEKQAFRLGSCFGSGMRKGDVCGACTGALMVLGLMFGEDHDGDPDERLRSNRINDMMLDRFKQVNGTYICNELLGCDITTPEGVQYARENGLFRDFCPKMVASAVDILESIIKEMK